MRQLFRISFLLFFLSLVLVYFLSISICRSVRQHWFDFESLRKEDPYKAHAILSKSLSVSIPQPQLLFWVEAAWRSNPSTRFDEKPQLHARCLRGNTRGTAGSRRSVDRSPTFGCTAALGVGRSRL